MRRYALLGFSLALIVLIAWTATAETRTEVAFPDLPGYVTLKCDFHMHTVFSDGEVWPTVRVREAWRHGLDAIAITDHVEHQSGNGDVDKSNGNRAYEIAKPEADRRHLILIRGGEITRMEPHGHFNALGLSDTRPLNQKKNRESVQAAIDQDAFLIWNHPPTKDLNDASASKPQREYLEKGWMRGIEVFNGNRYYPHAHAWCLEHNLTMMGNTDVHGLVDERHDPAAGQMRSMTLVFAEGRSEKAILDALRARRTVAFGCGMLVGEAQYVGPLFHGTVEVTHGDVSLAPRKAGLVSIHNGSSLTYQLEANGRVDGVGFPATFELPAGKTVFLPLSAKGTATAGTEKDVAIPYIVKNVLVAPNEGLPVTFDVHVSFPGKG
ncbi:MAG: hypothetical protein GY851_26625 [bacterium]|nr:hypothetical protein [bacterium]